MSSSASKRFREQQSNKKDICNTLETPAIDRGFLLFRLGFLASQVQQYALSETWMVLGPDLVGWKLTEARLWAMLREEEALQAS